MSRFLDVPAPAVARWPARRFVIPICPGVERPPTARAPFPMFLRASLLLLAVPALASAQTLRAEIVTSQPGQQYLVVEFAPGVADTVYVVERAGLVLRFVGGQLDPTPFLDITDRVLVIGEGGLLGLAFDPDFQTSGHVYASYTTHSTNGDSVVARFTVADPARAAFADPASETVLFGPLVHTGVIHRAGDLEFGPDGMLYYSLGDGDVAGPTGAPSQDISDPRGSILRFDVRAPFPHVPADNPFAGVAGAEPLIWAFGLRNPLRFDVDPATGDLFTGDVGDWQFEEVNWIPFAEPGLNFGWSCREGFQCTGSSSCTCPSSEFRDPIGGLPHEPTSQVCAVVGGVFVRGGEIPGLEGTYLFSDFCSGHLFAILDPTGAATMLDLSDDFRYPGGQPIRQVVDFEQAPTGEIYFVTQSGGRLGRILPPEDFGTYCTSNPNSAGARASIVASGSPSISAGNLVLEVSNLPFHAAGLFLMSLSTNYMALPVGQGTLCVGAPIYRWGPPSSSGSSGSVQRTSDLTDLPSPLTLQPGDTWFFQYWTRDANPGPTSNTSNGASVRFVQ